jgi:hypothetical protein
MGVCFICNYSTSVWANYRSRHININCVNCKITRRIKYHLACFREDILNSYRCPECKSPMTRNESDIDETDIIDYLLKVNNLTKEEVVTAIKEERKRAICDVKPAVKQQ